MTAEPDITEAVAQLEAELRGKTMCVQHRGELYLTDHFAAPPPGITTQCYGLAPHEPTLDHTSAQGERWFCDELRLSVEFGNGDTAWEVHDLSGSWTRDKSRSTAIRLAIEAMARQAQEAKDD